MRNTLFLFLASILLLGVASPAGSQEPTNTGPTATDGQNLTLVGWSGVPLDQEKVDYFVRVRADYGLSSSLEDIQRVIDGYGVAFEWGFPLAPEELKELEARLAIQQELSDNVIMGFMDLPGYAGFYFDHHNGGAPTVLVTDPDKMRDVVVNAVPDGLKNQVVVAKADFSWDELVAAADAIVASTDETIKDQVHRIAIKVRTNRLEISVLDASRVAAVRAELARITPVPFTTTVAPLDEPATCTSRSNCYSKMRAGIEVDGGGWASTLGFGVLHNGDKQFVMAGHHSASYYSHPGYGTIGSTAENEYWDNGIDARAIYATDSQVSDDIYVTAVFVRDIIGIKYPSVGLSVCFSGLINVSCGTVQDDYLYYSTSTVSDLLGASADFYAQFGDSGAPVYFITGGASAQAVGLVSTITGDTEFSRTWDFWARMGLSVLTS